MCEGVQGGRTGCVSVSKGVICDVSGVHTFIPDFHTFVRAQLSLFASSWSFVLPAHTLK